MSTRMVRLLAWASLIIAFALLATAPAEPPRKTIRQLVRQSLNGKRDASLLSQTNLQQTKGRAESIFGSAFSKFAFWN